MRKFLLGVIFVFTAFCMKAQLTLQQYTYATAPGDHIIHFYQFKPPHYAASGPGSPLIISLAGIGEQGNGTTEITNLFIGGLPRLLNAGATMEFNWGGKTEGFVVLAPQLPKGAAWSNPYTDGMIQYAIANLNVDPNRIFLTGYSLGGVGVWDYATTTTNPIKLAGIAPISAGYPSGAGSYCNIAQNQVATWAFHSLDDGNYSWTIPVDIVNQINSCSGLVVPAVDTVYPDGAHAIWDPRVYDTTNNTHYPNLYQWMLKVNRGINVANDAIPVPVVAGGTVTNLLAPVKQKNFPVLDGSGSTDDDIIMDYLWYQTGGPTSYLGPDRDHIRNQWPTVAVNTPNQFAMEAGSYAYLFRVKDYLTSKLKGVGPATHTVVTPVTINISIPASGHAAPATDAGGTQTLAAGTGAGLNSWNQIGRAFAYTCTTCGYTCTNCELKSYNWIQLPGADGGPVRIPLNAYNNPGTPYTAGAGEVSIYNIVTAGVYKFQFSATNKANDIGADTLTIIKLAGALPVTYSYFNGQNNGDKNILTWATTSEINSARFDVLSSSDGLNFTVAGAITAKGGSVLTEYSFEDNNSAFGITYYRLSQVDKDGHTSLSKTIAVNNRKTGIYIEKYPNPVHDNLTVTIQGNTNGNVQVVIADMQGKTILQQQWQKELSLLKKTLSVVGLQNGVYQMIISIGQEKKVSSFVKF